MLNLEETSTQKEVLPNNAKNRASIHYNYKSNWETPWDVFEGFNKEFNFKIDASAQKHNTKCDFYYSPEMNAFKQNWAEDSKRLGGPVWLNPPCGRGETTKWVKKAFTESQRGATVVCLLPSNTDTKWFHEWVLGKAEIRFLKGRVQFKVPPGMSERARNPGGSILAIFRPGKPPESVFPVAPEIKREGKNYQTFLSEKRPVDAPTGLKSEFRLNENLYQFQEDIVRWALERGRAAIFADCGLGKTIMQLSWADEIVRQTKGRILLLAPLAVAAQTVEEGHRFGIKATYLREDDGETSIVVTNYEMLDRFDPKNFIGVILDESSILKSFTGKIRNQIIGAFKNTPYRLACTATPAPNDFMELGNHAQFLNIMTREEMLAMFFVHDGGEVQKWRLKGHAQKDFWNWICSWAVLIRDPKDLGYPDDSFELPELSLHEEIVNVSNQAEKGMMFAREARTLSERLQARKKSVEDRARHCADLVNKNTGHWIIWCNLNSEAEEVTRLIPDAVEVRGSDKREIKEEALLGFTNGDIRVLVTKPSIAGFGMNWQHCNQVAFLGLSDSFEQFYQAVRRCWRFGQEKSVDVHVITASTEGAVLRNIKRKEADAKVMSDAMIENSKEILKHALHKKIQRNTEHKRDVKIGTDWTMHLGDCVEIVRELDANSIDYSIFSPPFASLYTYSDSERDMGNCTDYETFREHFAFLIEDLYRVIRPGRLVSVHCMNLPTSKSKDGMIGLRDFRGEIIRAFQGVGWVYHSEVCIWKDPVVAMQRTKALGLLYKQLRKDSGRCRQGIPDYLVTFRKDGENEKPIEHTKESFPLEFWQEYASPIWTDINQSRTLQKTSAREEKDERHIAPLQLDVIERGLDMWSTEGDVVLSPFAGIGSEGYCAVRKKRKFVGVELKESYWRQAVLNLTNAEQNRTSQLQMFERA